MNTYNFDPFDPINYQALILLEALGNQLPTQSQIDRAELLIKDLLGAIATDNESQQVERRV